MLCPVYYIIPLYCMHFCNIPCAVFVYQFPRNTIFNKILSKNTEYNMRGRKDSEDYHEYDPMLNTIFKLLKCYNSAAYNQMKVCDFLYKDARDIVKKSIDRLYKDSCKKGRKRRRKTGCYVEYYDVEYFM